MKKLFLYSLLFLAFFTECKNDPCLKGSGDSGVEIRKLNNQITTIVLNDNLDLDIIINAKDTSNYIKVSGGENVIPFVNTHMDGGSLILENKNKCYFLRSFDQDIKLELHINTFGKIEYNGSGTLNMINPLVGVDRFEFIAETGSGSVLLQYTSRASIVKALDAIVDITLKGEAHIAYYFMEASSVIDASEFGSNIANVQNHSTGDCSLEVYDELTCSIYSLGNIRYSGQPDSVFLNNREGKGALINLD